MRIYGTQVVAIDDQKTDLDEIVRALQRASVSVLPFLYKGRSSLIQCLPGIRIVFSDINLQPSAASPHSQHQIVAAVLDKVLHKENGPWVFVAWTASPDQVSELEIDLRTALGPKRALIAAVALAKSEFQDAAGEFRVGAITAAIRSQLARDPVVSALLDLEARAIDAAREITHSIVDLSMLGQASVSGSVRIANILKAIAKAANASASPSPEGVFRTLGPVFEDRLARMRIGTAERQIWTDAFKVSSGSSIDPKQTAALHSSLHLDSRGGTGERGSVSLIPPERIAALENVLKLTMDQTVFEHFVKKDKAIKSLRDIIRKESTPPKPAPAEVDLLPLFHDGVKWCLLEAAAACDASNDKRGLRRAILGLVVPLRLGAQVVAGAHVIELPTLSVGGEEVTIYFSARFTLSPLPRGLGAIKPIGRLRNPLLDAVLQHVSGSQSRLGWITF